MGEIPMTTAEVAFGYASEASQENRHLANRVQTLEQEVHDLRIRLDRLEKGHPKLISDNPLKKRVPLAIAERPYQQRRRQREKAVSGSS